MYDIIDNFNVVSAVFRHLVTSTYHYINKNRIFRSIDVGIIGLQLFRQLIIETSTFRHSHEMSLFRHPIIPTSHYSDIPLFRHPIIPTSHYSDIPLFRHPIIPTSHYSDIPLFRHPIIPTSHYSDIPLFRHPIIPTSHYSVIPLFRHPIIPSFPLNVIITAFSNFIAPQCITLFCINDWICTHRPGPLFSKSPKSP